MKATTKRRRESESQSSFSSLLLKSCWGNCHVTLDAKKRYDVGLKSSLYLAEKKTASETATVVIPTKRKMRKLI